MAQYYPWMVRVGALPKQDHMRFGDAGVGSLHMSRLIATKVRISKCLKLVVWPKLRYGVEDGV